MSDELIMERGAACWAAALHRHDCGAAWRGLAGRAGSSYYSNWIRVQRYQRPQSNMSQAKPSRGAHGGAGWGGGEEQALSQIHFPVILALVVVKNSWARAASGRSAARDPVLAAKQLGLIEKYKLSFYRAASASRAGYGTAGSGAGMLPRRIATQCWHIIK